MKIFFTIGILLLLAGTSSAQCTNIPQTHGHLQWSEAARMVAPGHAWQVEVHPALTSDENQTPVSLHSCRKSGSWPLFTLERRADIYWGPRTKNLLILNEPVSGGYQLLLFDAEALSEGKQMQPPDEINEAVKNALTQRLGEKKQIVFYIARFVSWKESGLVLAVGGTTSSGSNGPMASYCFGFLINASARQVQDVLSAEDLKRKFGAQCRVSP